MKRPAQLRKKVVRLLVLLSVFAALAPVCAVEGLYRVGIRASGAACDPSSTEPPDEVAAAVLWAAASEDAPPRVQALWPWVELRQITSALRGEIPTPPEGARAAQIVARRCLSKQGRTTMKLWHLRLWATTVWVTRHWSAVELTRELAAQMPFGRRAVGLDAAAQTFFGRPAHALSPSELALLGATAASATRYDPVCAPERAKARRDRILQKLATWSVLSRAEYEAAIAIPIAAGLSSDLRCGRR